MKKITTFLLCVMVAVSLIGCGSNASGGASGGPTDLTGTWETEDNDGSWMEATIESDVISVYWVSDDGDTRSIYWIGSYTAPGESTDDYTWTSERDEEAIGNALLASGSDTKDFTYDGDSISTDVSMLGTTRTMHFYRAGSEGAAAAEEPEQEEEPDEQEEPEQSQEPEQEEETGNEEKTENSNSDALAIGDTWTVDGQWEFTIDSVEATDERNEFDDSDPAQVIIINYHYENTGYEDQNGIWDGLYMDPSGGTLIDADRNVCSSYPADITYPQETPVNAICTAQCAFGLMSDGNTATLTYSLYDGNGVNQKVEYDLTF